MTTYDYGCDCGDVQWYGFRWVEYSTLPTHTIGTAIFEVYSADPKPNRWIEIGF